MFQLFAINKIKSGKKGNNNMKKLKTTVILVIYVLLIIFQFGAFIPYTVTETYISSQNVPHTVTVLRGYDGINNISEYNYKGQNGVIQRKRINYPLLTFHFALITCAALLAYYFLCYKGNRKQVKDVSNKELSELKSMVNKLSSENAELIKFKKEYEKFLSEKDSYKKTQNYRNLPKLDINALAFADEETQERAKKQYAEEMYRYVKMSNPNTFDEASAATQDLFANEQLSLADISINEPPCIDINSLAFADEETVRQIQKQYAEDLYAYITCKLGRE